MIQPRASSSPRRRRWWRFVALAGALLVVAVAAAPFAIAHWPFKGLLISAAERRIDGRVTVETIELGWFSPPRLEGLSISTNEGEPVFRVPRIVLDRPLWRLATDSSDVGHVRVENPRLYVEIMRDGTNLKQVFSPLARRGGQPRTSEAKEGGAVAQSPDVRLDVRLVNARVTWRTEGSNRHWNVDGLNLAAGLEPSWAAKSGKSELVIEQGKVVKRCRITRDMCNDVLQFAVPVLHNVGHVSGEFSLDLDKGRMPLGKPEQGRMNGRLSLHKVEVGPGSVVRSLAIALAVQPRMTLARESRVELELRGGRVYHRGLRFRLAPLLVSTSGSVGLDESLDLVAEIGLDMPAEIAKRVPVLDNASGETIRVNIRGTLAKPRVEMRALKDTGLRAVTEALDQLQRKLATARSTGGKPSANSQAETAEQQSEFELERVVDGMLAFKDLLRQNREKADADDSDQSQGMDGTNEKGRAREHRKREPLGRRLLKRFPLGESERAD